MSHAQVCPICKGTGLSSCGRDRHLADASRPDIPAPPLTFQSRCHGCDGKGWVVVPDDSVPVVRAKDKTSERALGAKP